MTVSIKSGNNRGNGSQIAKMRDDFKAASRTLRTGKSHINVKAVNGCCYGIDRNPDKGDYFKLCGQEFWYFISGLKNLYIDIIEPIAENAKQRNEEFYVSYTKMLNLFTQEFITNFCTPDGEINWENLVKYNSGSDKL